MNETKVSQQINDVVGDNVKKLAQLFPSAVKDGEVDFEALKEELGSFTEVGAEKYELTWAGKAEAKRIAREDIIGKTLKYIPEDSKDADTTENLYIEGDNLEVLKLLRQNYYGAIKMIYIDPPYNTGNDFVYNDLFEMHKSESDFGEGVIDELGERYTMNNKSHNRFHASWLNMILPRLLIAKDLLADGGVIFVSIDDNELANMQKLCNEVFGEENFAATFLWTKTSTPPALSYKSRKTVEYVLAYEKNISTIKYYGSPLDGGDAPLLNAGNPIKNILFPAGTIHCTYMQDGIISAGKKDKVTILEDIVIENGLNRNAVHIEGEFKWEQDTLNKETEKGTYFLIKTEKCSIRFQRRNTEDSYKTPTNDLNLELNKERGVGTNESAVKELSGLGIGKCFDYAKPTSLLETLINMVCKFDTEATILDFFSGSSSTAHAVMNLNAKDSGTRKFIMVQLPEVCEESTEAYKLGFKNICEIGKERIRRAGDKIRSEYPEADIDIGFKVFRVSDTNIKWNSLMDMGQLDVSQIESTPDLMDFMPNTKDIDVVYELMLRQRDVALSESVELLSDIGSRTYLYASSFLVCLETEVTESLVEKIAAIDPLPIKFIFRDSAFKDDIALKDETFRRLKALVEKNSGESKPAYTVEFI